MKKTQVAIIGGGLAGLNAARLLQAAGVSFHLFEARDRLGGRILTVDGAGRPAEDGFDLGPSWYWPRMQPAIGDLVADLGLAGFPQAADGDMMFERSLQEGPRRYPALPQDPPSMRLRGGTGALIRALAAGLPAGRLHPGRPVTALALGTQGLALTVAGAGEAGARDADGDILAEQVIAALPPRLMEGLLRFTPDLAPETRRLWQATPTWMAPHAKVVAVYDRPFWRMAGLSGSAQSLAGPMPEIHDASTAGGQAALFGFVGIPARHRAAMGEAALVAACLAQLERTFGPEAAHPRATLVKDWAADPLTATGADPLDAGHPAPAAVWVQGAWGERLHLAGSEASDSEPGYLAGAVSASSRAVSRVLRQMG